MVTFLNVDIYNDDLLFEEAFSGLSEYRRKKIRSYRFRKDQNLSLGVGVLLDRGLRDYGLSEAEMEYGSVENGKPVFLNAPEIFFNVSHSGHMAMAAFSNVPVGCDIEIMEKADLRVADRFFTENECRLIREAPSGPDEMFFRLWTLKESFMKVTGYGMKLPLSEFEMKLHDDGTFSVIQSVDHGFYRFTEYDHIPGYRCAFCLKEAHSL